MPPTKKPAITQARTAHSAAAAIPAPWTRERDQRGDSERRLDPRRDADGAQHHPGHPAREHERVAGRPGADDVADVEDLDGHRGRDEQQRADGGADRDPQRRVGEQQPEAAVLRATPRRRHRRAPGMRISAAASATAAKLAAFAASAELGAAGRGQRAGHQRAGGEAGVARGLDPAVGLRERVLRRRPGRAPPRPGRRSRRRRRAARSSTRIGARPSANTSAARDRRLRERDQQQQAPRLDAVHEPARRAARAATTGPISAANSAATAKPEPVRSCTRSASTTTSSMSPAAESSTAPESRRRSRGAWVIGLPRTQRRTSARYSRRAVRAGCW